jgi:hypothetical protein
MTVPICLEMPAPPELPYLEIPQFGIMSAARQSLYDLPDLSTYLMSLQEVAALALAPVRRFLEMVEIILAIKSCQDAIIEALLPPSPGPIIECIKDLIKAIARLASYFPPLEYVKSMLSLCKFIIQVIDEVVDLFVFLDQQLANYILVLQNALELGDLELGALADCAGSEITALTVNMMDVLKYVTPILKILLEPLARLVPIPALREALKKIANLPALLTDIKSAVGQADGPPVIGGLMSLINDMRNAVVILYNVLAPVVGRDSDLKPRTLPTFQVL